MTAPDRAPSLTLAELEAALRRIMAKHRDTTEFYRQHHEFPTEYAKHWHDGFVTALATCAIIAHEALDPKGCEREISAVSGTRYCVCGPDDPCRCGPHELATEPQTCSVCRGRGTLLMPAEVVAKRLGTASDNAEATDV